MFSANHNVHFYKKHKQKKQALFTKKNKSNKQAKSPNQYPQFKYNPPFILSAGRHIDQLTSRQQCVLMLALMSMLLPTVQTCHLSTITVSSHARSINTHDSIQIHQTPTPPHRQYAMTQSNPFFQQKIVMSVTDITHLKENCVKKYIGHSTGKICDIEGVTYYMKSYDDEYQNPVLGAYNLLFLKKNVGITVPRYKILRDAGKLYFGSEAIPNFISYYELRSSWPWHYGPFNTNLNKDREHLVEKIGEDGITKFMVALTFIDDLNAKNWGFDKDGLVLIDVDIAPITLNRFFSRMGQINQYGISLSMSNIKEMCNIYTSMLTKPLPDIAGFDSMSLDTYQTVLNVYIHACQHLIEHSSDLFPHLTETEPSLDINKSFVNLIKDYGKVYVENNMEHSAAMQSRKL